MIGSRTFRHGAIDVTRERGGAGGTLVLLRQVSVPILRLVRGNAMAFHPAVSKFWMEKFKIVRLVLAPPYLVTVDLKCEERGLEQGWILLPHGPSTLCHGAARRRDFECLPTGPLVAVALPNHAAPISR